MKIIISVIIFSLIGLYVSMATAADINTYAATECVKSDSPGKINRFWGIVYTPIGQDIQIECPIHVDYRNKGYQVYMNVKDNTTNGSISCAIIENSNFGYMVGEMQSASTGVAWTGAQSISVNHTMYYSRNSLFLLCLLDDDTEITSYRVHGY